MSGRRYRFDRLDGTHPFRNAVPDGYVDYPVRTRPGGRVFLFNFELAREMGLIAHDHPDSLDASLRAEILACFSLEIINEYDQERNPSALADAGPGRYMATRYLQLQHPGRQGRTSGDGRSVWNGMLCSGEKTWDVSSCGTGATRLSPATALHGRFFRTGDPKVSYGCGRASLWDSLCAALMSEILHRNGVRTERTLAIIDYGDGTCIGVRAYPNLLRPAHLLHWLKQGDHARLNAAVDYYARREIDSGRWPLVAGERARHAFLLERVTADFARMAAQFESEYIFCWLDWDGDNILLDGAIIDYGSVRQFGLFHHEYRYDDVERLSTNIAEQRLKARYIVQCMAQAVDFLESGRKKNIRSFRRAPAVRRFDELFTRWKQIFLLEKAGFDPAIGETLLGDDSFMKAFGCFARAYHCFERTKSRAGRYPVSDGITWDAVFCMRDILRELPGRLLDCDEPLGAEEFVDIMRSSYAGPADVRLYPSRVRRIRSFQTAYLRMVARAAEIQGCSSRRMLLDVERRASRLNPRDRITGDGVLIAARKLMSAYKHMKHKDLYTVFRAFVVSQTVASPRPRQAAEVPTPRGQFRALHGSMLRAIRENREGL